MLSLKIVRKWPIYNNYTELGKYATIVLDTNFCGCLSLPIDFVGTKSASL